MTLTDIVSALVGPDTRFHPLYILAAIVMAYGVYFVSRPRTSFRQWLLPREVWAHESTRLDIKLFIVGRVLSLFGAFNQFAITNAVAVFILTMMSGPAQAGHSANTVLAGFLILIANDFGVYWVHRIHHETRTLWPFHSVHHSAEVMTPITVYRKHPVYDLISSWVRGIFYGLVQGIVLALFVGPLSVSTIIGVNAFYFFFNLLGSNLRHSHIWLSYGRVLEHIIISPAQHQIHHSRAVEHHDKNYGEVLAIWDWMFGTLYVPEKQEVLEFGLADATGRPLPQPHNTLTEALGVPFENLLSPLRARKTESEK